MKHTAIRTSLLILAALCSACAEEVAVGPLYDTARVATGSIRVSVGSAGVVEPLAIVEVKSKASGEVLEVRVETGDDVAAGDLLVRIDPRTVRNRLAQADAALKAARSRQAISGSQLERAESLVQQGTFTEADYEVAVLDLADAEAQVVTAEVEVENARIAVEDTEIRAPVSGTIIEKPVEQGQVISSPTLDVGGGTALMKMADLSAVQVRALIDETDIGKVRQGMSARVTVAAYPNQPFAGEVVKIEPQAVVEQNVTMFAVILSIQNPDGLLLPGMNAEVEVAIADRRDVLTVPIMALRTERDIASTASILGVSDEALREELRAARPGGASAEEEAPPAESGFTFNGRTIQLPEGTDEKAVRQLVEKRRSGSNLTADERRVLRTVFAGARNGAAGRRGMATAPEPDYRFGGDFWVVVQGDDASTTPVHVRAGLTDLDRVEVISGLTQGQQVLILPSANLIETQERLQSFINRRVGGLTGMGKR